MCTALPNSELLYFSAADRAGFAFTAIHTKIILKLTAAIDPVDAGAVAADAFLQHRLDRFMQRLSLFLRNRIRLRGWMQLRNVQTLIGVDVAKTGEKCLVEEQWF